MCSLLPTERAADEPGGGPSRVRPGPGHLQTGLVTSIERSGFTEAELRRSLTAVSKLRARAGAASVHAWRECSHIGVALTFCRTQHQRDSLLSVCCVCNGISDRAGRA